MCQTSLNEPLLEQPRQEQQRQEEQNRSLEMLDQSVQADRVKALSGEDVYRIEKEEGNAAQLRRTLGINMAEHKAFLLGKQPATFYERDVTRYEKQKKKKGEQERDANERARQKGLIYASDQQAALQQDVLAHLRHAKEDVLPPTYRKSGAALTGKEFNSAPETGVVDITGLLEKRRRLQHQSKMFRDARKRGEQIDLDVQCELAADERALAVLDDAVRTYYAANGVDCDTGRSVSTRTQRNAQQHLALAMEKYREFMANRDELPANILLENVTANVQANRKVLEQVDSFVKEDTGYDYASKLNEIRQWIAEKPENYASNRKVIDNLYREYLSCAKSGGELSHEARLMNSMLDMVRSKDKDVLETGETGQSSDPLYEKAKELIGRRTLPLETHADRIHTAMRYLLTGKDPKDEGDLLFIEKHCGINTENRKALKEKEEIANRIPPIQLRRSQGDPEAEELALKYGKIRLEFIDSYLKAKAQYDANPEEESAGNVFTRLDNFLNGGGSSVVANMQEHMSRINKDDMQRVITAKNAKWTSSDREVRIFNASAVSGTRGGVYRDMALHVMPLGHAGEMTEEQLGNACDSFHVLTEGTHLNKVAATAEEKKGAVDNELKVQRDAYADIQQFIAEHPQIADASRLQPHELLDIYPDCFKLHGKSQELASRASELEKHTGLTKEERQEISKMYRFFIGVRDYAREMGRNIRGWQKYLQGESDAEKPLPFQSTLGDASDEF